tara:strand:- start:1062 stop:1307 length:246 start_codon:yes stop_codon:yes gene_type:complete
MSSKTTAKKTETKDMTLSSQALGAIMMALQRSLMNQQDIVPLLSEFKFRLSENGLMVMNPPVLHGTYDDEGDDDLNIPATD